MTDICERLRFKDRHMRKAFLVRDLRKLQVPPFAYNPLCGSDDTYYNILACVPKLGYAFQTKARCPCMVMFEVERHPEGSDVATFLQGEVHHYTDTELRTADDMKTVDSAPWHEGGIGADEVALGLDEGKFGEVLLLYSIMVLSCFMWSAALDSSHVLLLYSITSLASRITIILIKLMY
mgnify:CR=1 FL=1